MRWCLFGLQSLQHSQSLQKESPGKRKRDSGEKRTVEIEQPPLKQEMSQKKAKKSKKNRQKLEQKTS